MFYRHIHTPILVYYSLIIYLPIYIKWLNNRYLYRLYLAITYYIVHRIYMHISYQTKELLGLGSSYKRAGKRRVQRIRRNIFDLRCALWLYVAVVSRLTVKRSQRQRVGHFESNQPFTTKNNWFSFAAVKILQLHRAL